MTQELWTAVDEYLSGLLVPHDPILDAVLEASAAAGLPAINVAPNQGKLLYLLARMNGARAILEIGTLGGYSTIWLARALPAGGCLITLESDPKHAEVARVNIDRVGLTDIVDVRVGKRWTRCPNLPHKARARSISFSSMPISRTSRKASDGHSICHT